MTIGNPLTFIRRTWAVRKLPYWYAEAEKMYLSVWGQKMAFERSRSEDFETVVFGSSHAHKGYWAEGADFNFANSHIDLYTSVSLFGKLCDRGVRMRRAVLFYDVFSSGFETQRPGSWFKAVPYRMLFDIPFYVLEPPDCSRLIRCLGYLPETACPAVSCGNNRYDWFFPPDTDVAERVLSHVRNHRRGNEQDAHIAAFVDCARRRGIEPFVVSPPLRADYLRELDRYEDVFANVRRICERTFRIPFLDFSHSGFFRENDFGDQDHLNRQGAVKLTKQLKKAFEGGYYA